MAVPGLVGQNASFTCAEPFCSLVPMQFVTRAAGKQLVVLFLVLLVLVEHDPNALEKLPRSITAVESATNRVAR